ncbi:phage tail protein [Streptacidiphilus anmyonensis]|uniref:phage tail protein n=1 Tax=Streptacidiphilus anmyonensis TaxID=405782 RepID=UPI000A8AD6DD|nr:phage tail protein [Streptacidiphilus anmyonensis]
MRGTVPGLATPSPMGRLMPAIFQEDGFAMRLTDALDEVLAPVIATLDCLTAYLDPLLAPDDFLSWLAGWFDVALDENWNARRRREMVAHIVELYRWRGTPAGLARQLEIATGAVVDIDDSGGVVVGDTPGTALPGRPEPHIGIRIRGVDPGAVDLVALEDIVRACKPAHLRHSIEVIP